MWKWLHCFVEWEDDDGTWKLSVIPWHIFIKGIIGKVDFKWHWVVPWKIYIEN